MLYCYLLLFNTDLEANRSQLLPYIYYPNKDLLLKASKAIKYGGENGLQGCYLLYLLLRHHSFMATKRLDEVTLTNRYLLSVDGQT